MQAQIRRVGFGLVIAFLAVFLQLNYVQIFAAEDIAGNNANIRGLIREYSIKRGDIISLDGKPVAVSKATKDKLKYLRTYPGGDLFGHITGFYSVVYGEDRIERSFHEQMLGEAGVLSMQDIQDRFLGSEERGDDVRLTVDSRLQEAARRALGRERGAVVAMNPQNGEIKAMWSNPSYDPTLLASHDGQKARRFWKSLRPKSPLSPLISLSTSRLYPPGSTFKVVTAAAALESGKYDRDSSFPDPAQLDLPLTNETLTNFTKTSCAGGGQIDLFNAMRISCDTTFGILGLDIPGEILDMSEKLGFNDRLPIEVSSATSDYPDIADESAPLRAFSAIGQGDTSATPLQMALVAATVANGGEVPKPHLVREVTDAAGGPVRKFAGESLGRAMSAPTANILTEMMVSVVDAGTGTAAQISGVEVAGKTGTAQTGREGENPHTWFIAFAPARNPQIAVAVLVENGGSFGSEATGGAVAAPIAKAVMEADRRLSRW